MALKWQVILSIWLLFLEFILIMPIWANMADIHHFDRALVEWLNMNDVILTFGCSPHSKNFDPTNQRWWIIGILATDWSRSKSMYGKCLWLSFWVCYTRVVCTILLIQNVFVRSSKHYTCTINFTAVKSTFSKCNIKW